MRDDLYASPDCRQLTSAITILDLKARRDRLFYTGWTAVFIIISAIAGAYGASVAMDRQERAYQTERV